MPMQRVMMLRSGWLRARSGREQADLDQVVQVGVIARDLLGRALAEEVRAAVADVGDLRAVSSKHERDARRPHVAERDVLRRLRAHRRVGAIDRVPEPALDSAVRGFLEARRRAPRPPWRSRRCRRCGRPCRRRRRTGVHARARLRPCRRSRWPVRSWFSDRTIPLSVCASKSRSSGTRGSYSVSRTILRPAVWSPRRWAVPRGANGRGRPVRERTARARVAAAARAAAWSAAASASLHPAAAAIASRRTAPRSVDRASGAAEAAAAGRPAGRRPPTGRPRPSAGHVPGRAPPAACRRAARRALGAFALGSLARRRLRSGRRQRRLEEHQRLEALARRAAEDAPAKLDLIGVLELTRQASGIPGTPCSAPRSAADETAQRVAASALGDDVEDGVVEDVEPRQEEVERRENAR